VGDNVWIGEYTWIDNLTTVDIQNNVCISQGALLLCGNHHYKKPSFDLIVGKITLEEGAWVGAKAVVCPGVTLKSHSMLTVGSVATRSLEAYTINQGNPAVKIKDRVLKTS
jgi:putative colanic acid biosynthesis acetyltransferase WcaF